MSNRNSSSEDQFFNYLYQIITRDRNPIRNTIKFRLKIELAEHLALDEPALQTANSPIQASEHIFPSHAGTSKSPT